MTHPVTAPSSSLAPGRTAFLFDLDGMLWTASSGGGSWGCGANVRTRTGLQNPVTAGFRGGHGPHRSAASGYAS
jgi:hypothetical protein